jgi:hypothetical protein
MKNIILTLSLFGCNKGGEPPEQHLSDTTEKVDTIERGSVEISTTPEVATDGFTFPEHCTTVMENRDDHIAPKEKELRPKICNLAGLDQYGREINLYDFKGQVTVLTVMSTTCDECIAWLDNDGPFQQLKSKSIDVATMNVITTNRHGIWASPSDIVKLHSDYNLGHYPVLAVDPRTIGEGSGQFKPYRNDDLFSPMFYIIDKNMRLAWSSTGQPWHDSFHAWSEWHLPVQDLTLE